MSTVNFNVGGNPRNDQPLVIADNPPGGTTLETHFEGVPGQTPNRFVATVPANVWGGAWVYYQNRQKSFRIVLPLGEGPHEAGSSECLPEEYHGDVSKVVLAYTPLAIWLHTTGVNFVDPFNEPWFMRGYTVHTMPSLIHRGIDVGPIMDEALSYGSNTLVPICMHRSQYKIDHGFYLNPLDDLAKWQQTIATMHDLAAARYMRVASGCLADCQGLDQNQILRIWHAYCEVLYGRWNAFARGGNEDQANAWDCATLDLPDLGGVLASRGSRGINVPPFNAYWHWAEWEGRREPIFKAMDDGGAGILEMQHGYAGVGPFPCPLVHIERPVFNDAPTDSAGDTGRWTDPKLSLQLALNEGANFAGAAFLGSEAMECRPLGPLTAESARQANRGWKAAFLR